MAKMPKQRQIARAMDRVSLASDNLYLTICNKKKKTEVVYKPALGKLYSDFAITVNGLRLLVGKFTCLGRLSPEQ